MTSLLICFCLGVGFISLMASSQHEENKLKQQKIKSGNINPSQVVVNDVDQLDSVKIKKPGSMSSSNINSQEPPSKTTINADKGLSSQAAFQTSPKAPINTRKGSSSQPATSTGTGSTNLENRQLSPLIDKALRERQDAERKIMLQISPDYDELHRSILSWDYFDQGAKPPALSGKEPISRHVPPRLESASEYISGFGPLLPLECWAQFQQAKEAFESLGIESSAIESPCIEPSEIEPSAEISVPIEVTGRLTVGHFVDVKVTIPLNAIPVDYWLCDADVERLSEKTVFQETKVRTFLAKVKTFKRHPQGHQVTLRCCLAEDKQDVDSVLVNYSKWQLEKLFSLTTLHREFVALMTVAHFELSSDILNARLAPKPSISSEQVFKAVQGYGINEPQARAVLGSLSAEGFSLIQGPPGTGKTKTICALIGAFISRRKGPTASSHTSTRYWYVRLAMRGY